MANIIITSTEVSHDDLLAEATALGKEHGKNAASWLIDGNTSKATCISVYLGLQDSDPEIQDQYGPGNPLSGEYADDLTPRKLVEDEMNLDRESLSDGEEDEICEAYENAFIDAHSAEVERTLMGYVTETCKNCSESILPYTVNDYIHKDSGLLACFGDVRGVYAELVE